MTGKTPLRPESLVRILRSRVILCIIRMIENSKDESKKEDGDVPDGGENSRRKSSPRDIPRDDERPAWSSKLQYILAQVGFSVGLGNVWRFPYLCQKNGGGAYLIPYTVLLLVIGIPLFFLELALGQRLRRGSIGVWNYIHPRLRGIGYASCVVCFLVALYYNVIIAWSIFYFSQSFQDPLPWKECPLVTDTNDTYVEPECKKSSATTYYWYRNTLDISESITDGGGLNWRMTLCLLSAWIIVCLAMIKGIQSSGKVMYFSSLFPYVVLICFLVRGLLLEGSVYGIAHMFTPKMETMLDITVWREAATQVFFALGLGFGGVIAFSSYNKRDNNCHLDAVLVPCINFFTSVMATLVVFAVLGFKANVTISKCVMKNVEKIDPALIRQFFDLNHLTPDDYQKMTSILNATMGSNYSGLGLEDCDIREELNKAVQGTGLAFIAFTEAMTQLPGSPFWSVMFFLMLINLGLGSMFGTIQGILTPILDTFKVRKEYLTVGCCVFAFGIGLIFVQRSGSYFVSMFDDYSATLPLLLVVFFENISVAWIYGSDKFFEDLTDMLGFTPSHIYYYMWKFITPVVLGILLVASIVQMGMSPPGYSGWNQELAEEQALSYPPWGLAICMSLVLIAILPVPVVLILNCLKIIDGHDKKAHVKNGTASPPGDEGEDAKLLDATPTSDAPTPGDSHNIAIDITLDKSQGSGYAISKIETSDMSESNM